MFLPNDIFRDDSTGRRVAVRCSTLQSVAVFGHSDDVLFEGMFEFLPNGIPGDDSAGR